ncbi:Uma2 family endonuclease [Streptomyces sp. CAU 1734]|uniref:Uma2 family endonuclease n=1 Tax=Streptomyces sp. CAU 1734 TaxID=3140360 RepID=UPI00326057BE
MTPSTAQGGQMSVEDFEQLERHAPETVTLEFIKGKLEVKPMPDGDHGAIFMWLLRQCIQHRPDLDLHPDQGLAVEAYRAGRARPDGVLAPVAHFAGQGEWSHPDGVLMTVEITSHDSDTDRRDRSEKRAGYAEAGIPVYLLVDRKTNTLVVHSEPKDGTYLQAPSFSYGEDVELPGPVGFTLHTDKLKDYSS